MSLEALRSRETEHFRGIMTENYVSIALKTNGYQLYYWESDNTAEVDFLIQKENHVIPVECKAGNHVKSKKYDGLHGKICACIRNQNFSKKFRYGAGNKICPTI